MPLCPTTLTTTPPSTQPTSAPNSPINTPSSRNSTTISRRFKPIAASRPISRVRSNTAISIRLRMPTPAINNTISPKMFMTCLSTSSD